MFDPAGFSNDPYVKRVDKPWGYELHWVRDDAPYMGKVLHITAGARLSLQLHDAKQETWFLMNGQAKVLWDDSRGDLVETVLQPGQGYSTRHRAAPPTHRGDRLRCAGGSTPERGTTWRLEDDSARPNETPEQRKKERGES